MDNTAIRIGPVMEQRENHFGVTTYWLEQQQYFWNNTNYMPACAATIFGETKYRFSRRVLLLRFRLRSPQGTLIRVGVRPEWGRLAMYIRVSQNRLFSENRLTLKNEYFQACRKWPNMTTGSEFNAPNYQGGPQGWVRLVITRSIIFKSFSDMI